MPDKSVSGEKMSVAERREPLAGRKFATTGISLEPAPAATRISLRAGLTSVPAMKTALGIALPKEPKTTLGNMELATLWLGPDEWLVIGRNNKDLMASLDRIKGVTFSAVDISHRNTAIIVSGERVEAVLNSGCPQDLSLAAFPVGACSRTIMGKAEIVLWRTGETEFVVEVWRSFSEYVWKYLEDASRGI